jgi:hypothetical protein
MQLSSDAEVKKENEYNSHAEVIVIHYCVRIKLSKLLLKFFFKGEVVCIQPPII